MRTWIGKMILDNKEVEVTVNFIKPSINNFGKWYGYGYCDSVLNIDTYHTNIGEIIINCIRFNLGKCYFEFIGSGMPEGELKKYIDKM